MATLMLMEDWRAVNHEIWMPVKGYWGYEVSSWGRVRSRRLAGRRSQTLAESPKIIQPRKHRTGYWMIIIRNKAGIRKNALVHRLVAQAFLGNEGYQNQLDVNHINNVRDDNRVSNLEWATRKENIRHAVRAGTHSLVGENHHSSILTEKLVRQLRKEWQEIGGRKSDLADKYGLPHGVVGKVLRGTTWSHVI